MNKRESIIKVASIVVLTTLVTFLFSYIAFVVMQNWIPQSFLMIWNRWDTLHYIYIASFGYTNAGEARFLIVFFPFYPLLIKLFALILKNDVLSALVVSNLAYALSALYLYKLALLDYSEETALRAVFYLSIFPTAYFLHAGYTESLFLALTISSFYYARQERWWLSGLIGMLASTTRITGIVLLPALIIEYLSQRGLRIKSIRIDILWLALIPFGLVCYLIVNYLTFDDPLKFLEFQRTHWFKTLSFPWEGFLVAWRIMWRGHVANSILLSGVESVFAILMYVLAIWGFFRLRLSYALYMLITCLIVTSTSFWYSMPRFALSIFPVFIALSLFGKREEVNYLLTFISLVLFSLFLTLFIQGKWAF